MSRATITRGVLGGLCVLVLLAGAALAWRHFHDPLVGVWAATEKSSDGTTLTTTYTFLKDGLATVEVKTDRGSLLTVHVGGLPVGDAASPGGKDANPLAALFPTVRRVHIKGAYAVKGDVVTIHVSDVNFFGDHDQPVSMPNETHSPTQTFRYKVSGDTLTVDKLDGTTPQTLTRRAE